MKNLFQENLRLYHIVLSCIIRQCIYSQWFKLLTDFVCAFIFQLEDSSDGACAGDEPIAMEVDDPNVETYTNPTLTLEDVRSREEISLMFHDYYGNLYTQKLKYLNKEIQTDICMTVFTDAKVQTETLLQENCTQTVSVEMKSVGLQVQKPDITIEDIISDKSDIMFYTGIPNAGTFLALFDETNDVYENTSAEIYPGRPRALRKVDEFFMVLMRLRLGLLIEDLSQRFHISKSTCSETISMWITYLSVKLSFLISWPSQDLIRRNLPSKFNRYPKCRVIIDCTEIFTQTPQSLKNKSLLYSHYKSHMTYKSLIGISPNGVITFASDLWVGSISDMNNFVLKR